MIYINIMLRMCASCARMHKRDSKKIAESLDSTCKNFYMLHLHVFAGFTHAQLCISNFASYVDTLH